MMGLPTETMEDIEGIAETAQKGGRPLLQNTNHAKGRGVQVTISCACFVPKPPTPFQFVPMDTAETLQAKQKHLLESVHSRKIKVNYHDSTTSFLEGVFAQRVTAALPPVIVEAYKRGCYFDGWEECFKYDTDADLCRPGHRPRFLLPAPHRAGRGDPVVSHGLRHHPRVSGAGVQQGSGRPDHPPCNRACNACGANHLLGRSLL